MKIQKLPRQETIANWTNTYPEFAGIFSECNLNPLFNYFDPDDIITDKAGFIFEHVLKYQSSRVVAPPMRFDRDKDLAVIEKIKDAIARQAFMIQTKYELLAQTMPTSINDYMENYSISREKIRNKKYKQGTVVNSGADTTQSATNVTTTRMTSTGETESPRFESSSKTANTDGTAANQNQVSTTYGRTVTTNPGDEDTTENTTAHGYYNSGTKADMLKEIREVLDYNLVDKWVREILPIFCCAYYDPNWSIPSEFIL